MKKIRSVVLLGLLFAVGATNSGCQSTSGHGTGATAAPPTKVVLVDPLVAKSIVTTGTHSSELPDGRLEVMANVKNILNKRIQVEAQCIFTDVQGFSTGDETPWRTLILTEGSQETLRFVSLNNRARDFSIRIREAH